MERERLEKEHREKEVEELRLKEATFLAEMAEKQVCVCVCLCLCVCVAVRCHFIIECEGLFDLFLSSVISKYDGSLDWIFISPKEKQIH